MLCLRSSLVALAVIVGALPAAAGGVVVVTPPVRVAPTPVVVVPPPAYYVPAPPYYAPPPVAVMPYRALPVVVPVREPRCRAGGVVYVGPKRTFFGGGRRCW